MRSGDRKLEAEGPTCRHSTSAWGILCFQLAQLGTLQVGGVAPKRGRLLLFRSFWFAVIEYHTLGGLDDSSVFSHSPGV